MKTYYADGIRETASQVSEALGVPVVIGPRHMYGNANNYSLTINGVEVWPSASTDAIGGFLRALQFLDLDVVRDVFYRQEETGHQRALRTVPGYALDSEGHGPDCALRCDVDTHDECENEEWCSHNNYHYHECGAPEHLVP